MVRGFNEEKGDLYNKIKAMSPKSYTLTKEDIGQDVGEPMGVITGDLVKFSAVLKWDEGMQKIICPNWQEVWQKIRGRMRARTHRGLNIGDTNIGKEMFLGNLPDMYTIKESDVGKSTSSNSQADKIYPGQVGCRVWLKPIRGDYKNGYTTVVETISDRDKRLSQKKY